MRVEVQLESPIAKTFRVAQISGSFDVALEKKSRLKFAVDVPGIPGVGPGDDGWGDWKIGAIAGPSGAGKSVVARQVFGESFVEHGFAWPENESILDGFTPESLETKAITGVLSAVGFSEPPAWVLPYKLLSNGQRMRCDLARALLCGAGRGGGESADAIAERLRGRRGRRGGEADSEPSAGPPAAQASAIEVIAFDEFTSVVDRQVGQFASAAVAKAVRNNHVPAKRFVAVTCHYDVLPFLEPDWILDMATKTLARGSLRRPEIRLEVVRCEKRGAGQRLWSLFKRHHYLSAALHPAARCYVATWEGEPIAFCATIPNAGHKGMRIIHRLVVLPDYQGLGVGTRLLDAVASIESPPEVAEAKRTRISIRTSHPALIAALRRRPTWRVAHVMRRGAAQRGFMEREGRKVGSAGRTTVSFAYNQTLDHV